MNPSDADPRCIKIINIHSECVLKLAESLARASHYADAVDYTFLREAVMLHDLGIIGTDAKDIYCFGSQPYLQHGIIGAEYLRSTDPVRYARHARVCERHIGSGLTAEEIVQSHLPLPVRDFLPETLEEKLIAYADNFYSKNPDHITSKKSYEYILDRTQRFGTGPVERLKMLHDMWMPAQ